jgi:hypothetical protein
MLNLGLLQLILEQHLQRHYIFALTTAAKPEHDTKHIRGWLHNTLNTWDIGTLQICSEVAWTWETNSEALVYCVVKDVWDIRNSSIDVESIIRACVHTLCGDIPLSLEQDTHCQTCPDPKACLYQSLLRTIASLSCHCFQSLHYYEHPVPTIQIRTKYRFILGSNTSYIMT